MSLHQILMDTIKEKGQITIAEVYDICAVNGYKQSNAERRLRKSESHLIEPIWNETHKYIAGYKWVGMPMPQREPMQAGLGLNLGIMRFKS